MKCFTKKMRKAHGSVVEAHCHNISHVFFLLWKTTEHFCPRRFSDFSDKYESCILFVFVSVMMMISIVEREVPLLLIQIRRDLKSFGLTPRFRKYILPPLTIALERNRLQYLRPQFWAASAIFVHYLQSRNHRSDWKC